MCRKLAERSYVGAEAEQELVGAVGAALKRPEAFVPDQEPIHLESWTASRQLSGGGEIGATPAFKTGDQLLRGSGMRDATDESRVRGEPQNRWERACQDARLVIGTRRRPISDQHRSLGDRASRARWSRVKHSLQVTPEDWGDLIHIRPVRAAEGRRALGALAPAPRRAAPCDPGTRAER